MAGSDHGVGVAFGTTSLILTVQHLKHTDAMRKNPRLGRQNPDIGGERMLSMNSTGASRQIVARLAPVGMPTRTGTSASESTYLLDRS